MNQPFCFSSYCINITVKCTVADSDVLLGAGHSSVVRAFAHGAVCHQIDPSWGGPIELFLVPASAPQLV